MFPNRSIVQYCCLHRHNCTMHAPINRYIKELEECYGCLRIAPCELLVVGALSVWVCTDCDLESAVGHELAFQMYRAYVECVSAADDMPFHERRRSSTSATH